MNDLDVTEFGRWFHGLGWAMLSKPGRRLDPMDAHRENFTGYAIPSGSTTTVAELEAFYLHGKIGRGGAHLTPEELAEQRGYPVSGDWTTRRRLADGAKYGDIPEKKLMGALF